MLGETEERRKQLLHQVRGVKQYQGWDIPAIHPRFVWMKQEDVKIINVTSTQIVNQIGKTFLYSSFIGQ